MKSRILFVDDERSVLEGLQRMLRCFRREWDMYFALSGEQALTIMEANPIDIIVTDMRMPGMNGAQLLTEVMQRHPSIIRIVLSGHADSALIVESVSVTHQYISKPCDPQTLKSTIVRATELRALLEDANLRYLASQMGVLPSLPSPYLEMAQELQSPEASIQKVGQIIARDPGMTAKILQLANSSFFGRRRQVSNPAEAVSYLGLVRIQCLFLTIHAFSQFNAPDNQYLSGERLWKHSMCTAALAKQIAEAERAEKRTVEQAFTAGLLHDIGTLMLACRLPKRHAEAFDCARANNVPLWIAERETLCASHAEVGAYLLGLWALPDPIVEAVAYHHRPAEMLCKSLSPLTALHAADALDHEQNGEVHPGIPAAQVDLTYLTGLGLRDRLAVWRSFSAPAEVQVGSPPNASLKAQPQNADRVA